MKFGAKMHSLTKPNKNARLVSRTMISYSVVLIYLRYKMARESCSNCCSNFLFLFYFYRSTFFSLVFRELDRQTQKRNGEGLRG